MAAFGNIDLMQTTGRVAKLVLFIAIKVLEMQHDTPRVIKIAGERV